MATEDDESRGWVILTVGCITMSIAFTALACRIFTRAVLVMQFGADDWAAVVSGIMLLVCGLMTMTNVNHGLGRHVETLSEAQKSLHLKFLYISIIFYNTTLLCVKMAFLLQYYRVFSIPKTRRIILTCMVLIFAWSLAFLLLSIFTCTPIHKFWDYNVTKGSCVATSHEWYVNAGGNIVTDIVIFLLPMPVLKSINLRRSQKILVMGIFSLGFFTVVVSILRVKFLRPIAYSTDYSWENVTSSSWSIGELSSAVTCLCLPTLKPLLVRLRPNANANMSGSNSSNDSNRNRSFRSSFRQFLKHSGTSRTSRTSRTSTSSHLRSRSDGTHSVNGGGSFWSHHSQKEGRSGAFLSSTNRDDLYSAALDMGDGRGHGHGHSRGFDRESMFDTEAARRGYFLPPLPDGGHDSLPFPDSARCRDTIGMQGTVTTTIGSTRPATSGEYIREPPTGHITVRCDFQRDSSPRRV